MVPVEPAALLEQLREACAEKTGGGPGAQRFSFGCEAIDRVLPAGGLLTGAVHEFLGLGCGKEKRLFWTPPLSVILHLAQRAAERQPERVVVWVGERVWPFPSVLFGARTRIGERSIFVRARQTDERVWAADLALRSGAAAAVLIDGSGVDMSASRRLQLAAESGECCCLMARPVWELSEPSAAATRWSVSAAPLEPGVVPARRWIVELLRCKGVQPSAAASSRRWLLERDHATRHGLVASDLLDRPGETEAEAERRRSG
jgi:protein ImuA